MLQLENVLSAWGLPDFEGCLKQEISQLGSDRLPLQQGLTTGNYVSAAPITVVIIGVAEMGNAIRVKAGIFYQGLIGGCSCADDPAPDSVSNEYCEVRLDIDKATAETKIDLVTE